MTTEAQLPRAQGALASLTTLTNGRHRWVADVDVATGGTDAGPDPHDLLDSALAACTVLTLELYIRRKQLAVTQLRVDVGHAETKGADGQVHTTLTRTLHIEGALAEADRARLLQIANMCPIHKVLSGSITIESALHDASA